MRPLIGVTTSEVRPQSYAHEAPVDEPFRAEMPLGIIYTNALEAAGAAPVVLPPLGEGTIDDLLDGLDAVCLSGGPDVDPADTERASGIALLRTLVESAVTTALTG